MRFQNILLIDDDEDDCDIFLAAINEVSDRGNYMTSNNAFIALKELEEHTLQPDLIFLDLNMPMMNGIQFLTEIKKKETLKHIPVIIYSTSSHPDIIFKTTALGAHGFITKPTDFNKIVSIIKSIII